MYLETSKIEVADLAAYTTRHAFWNEYLTCVTEQESPIGLHLAVFAQPFLSFILDGRKTIESRFTRTRCAPFDQVRTGDVILLKQVGGPVCGLALAQQTWFFDLHHHSIETIRKKYGNPICGDESFWELKRDAAYATLIELAEPVSIDAIAVNKRDRRGWVALTSSQMSLSF